MGIKFTKISKSLLLVIMFDLIEATRQYWRQLDAVEAAYKRNELSLQEVNAEVARLMQELGNARRQALRDFWARGQYFVAQQREAIAGTVALLVIAYAWLAIQA